MIGVYDKMLIREKKGRGTIGGTTGKEKDGVGCVWWEGWKGGGA